MRVGIDEKGIADPVKAGEELAKAECPADIRRAMITLWIEAGAVEQEKQNGEPE